MRFLLFFAALLSISTAFAEQRSALICYFSLNNEKEFTETKKLADRLNKATGHNIQVEEFLSQGQDPNVAFERMVASGKKCDGLVISGHHYGAWEGKRAAGALKLDVIEKLSCDPRYENWFKNINSLHLQGCRTLGMGQIVPDDPAYSADANTSRVNRHNIEEQTQAQVEAGVLQMNHEFTNTLDQDNPLSSRYLRSFPRATTFGWTRSAPGEDSKSELSMLYHIAHMAEVNNYHQRGVIVDPFKDLTSTDAAELANAVLDMIQKPDWDHCENTSIEAWKNHGTPIKNKGLGYNNSDLNAYKSYESTNDSEMTKLKDKGCKLKNAKTQSERIAAIQDILQDQKTIAANFNSLIDFANSVGIGPHERNEILDLLSQSTMLQSFVGHKLNRQNNNQVGLFAKLDYYAFYKTVFKVRSLHAEGIINEETFKVLLKPYPTKSPDREDAIDFKATLTSALGKNGYPDEAFMNSLLNNPSPLAKKMYKEIYNKLSGTAKPANAPPAIKQLVEKLRPIAITIPN